MRFVADAMVGRLVRWLRISGYDTVYLKEAEDQEILRFARDEKRILLTRDRGLERRAAAVGVKHIFIAKNDIDAQLKQMMAAGVEIKGTPVCARCPGCNGKIGGVKKGDVEGKVPPGVFEKVEEFCKCLTCGKIYWEGGHWEDIKRRINRVRNDLNYSE